MRRSYIPVLTLIIVVLSCCASRVMWKRITLPQSGVISIPQSWRALEADSAVTENAYGPGVSCRTLLSA